MVKLPNGGYKDYSAAKKLMDKISKRHYNWKFYANQLKSDPYSNRMNHVW